jgi:hypothetical protein
MIGDIKTNKQGFDHVFGHTAIGKRPKFVLPFSPVRNAIFDIDTNDSTMTLIDSDRADETNARLNRNTIRQSACANDDFLSSKDKTTFFGKKSRGDYFYMYQVSERNEQVEEDENTRDGSRENSRKRYIPLAKL